MKPIELTDGNFGTEVLSSATPVLVDFWATWCGPCKVIAPMVEELAGEYAGKLKVGKVDVDRNSDTASRYGIRSIPTLLVFKDGEVAKRLVGAKPKSALLQELSEFLPAPA
jgi:thioredoxin 1